MTYLVRPVIEESQRARVADIAMRWIGTPYHHHAMIKGVGVDCATLLVGVFAEAGLVKDVALPPYSPQWHLHREEEKYTDFIRQFAEEVTRPPRPGDVVVWKFHRSFAHGGIVIEWPTVVHAFMGRGCIVDDATKNQMLLTVSENVPTQGQPRPMKTFSYWRQADDHAIRSALVAPPGGTGPS